MSTCEGCAQQKPDVQFTDGVRDYLCPDCRKRVGPDGEYLPDVKWKCTACGADCSRPDNQRGRQWETCACGQGVILLNLDRPDWID